MKLGDKISKAYRDSCSEKMISIRDLHQKEMDRISYMLTMPMTIEGREQHINVDDMTKIRLAMQQIKKYGKEVINAHIDAFIEIHSLINRCPDQEGITELIKELVSIASSLINWLPRHSSVTSSIPECLYQQVLSSFKQELDTIPGTLLPRLNKFVSESELRKEMNLPISSHLSQNVTNNVSILGSVDGGVQVGNQHSNQSVTQNRQLRQEELSDEQQAKAFTKISEFLKTKNIWKGDWINYQEVAEATELEIGVIKECVEYASSLAHLKILNRHPDGILLISSFGKM